MILFVFPVGEVLDSVSPALSSTPRKSLPNETVVTPFSCANLSDLTNDVLGWNSDLKATPYIKQEEKEVNEVVSKVDYLRLLDEMEELRQELDLLRQNAQLSQLSHSNIPKPVINNSTHLTRYDCLLFTYHVKTVHFLNLLSSEDLCAWL